jgi:hypothetical protein
MCPGIVLASLISFFVLTSELLDIIFCFALHSETFLEFLTSENHGNFHFVGQSVSVVDWIALVNSVMNLRVP